MVESYCSQVIGLRRITLQKRLRVFSCEFTPEHAQKPASVLPLIKLLRSIKSKFSAFFFLPRFLFMIVDDSHDSKGREGTNIQTFIFNFTSEMTTSCNF